MAYTICSLDNAPRVPFKFDGRILFSSGRYELVHLTLQPGDGMEAHTQPMDVVFYVTEGTGTLAIGDPGSHQEMVEVGCDTAVHLKAGISRAWKNTGGQPLLILVNKLLP